MPGTFVPVPNVGEFAVVQQLFGQNIVNVYHIKKEGGWTSATLADMCVVLISGYNDDIAPNLSTNLSFVIVRARDLTTAAGAVAEVNFPPASGGDMFIESELGSVACAIKHTTGFAGRSYRGRTFVGGIPVDMTNDGFLNPLFVTNIVNAFDALDGRINEAGGTWGVVSKYSGYTQSPPHYKKVPTPRAEGIFTDIINNSTDNKPDCMRRRLIGRGS